MNILERYKDRRENLDKFFLENEKLDLHGDELDLTFDIEVSPNEGKNKAITYSVAIMCCNDDYDICYKYNTMEQAIREIMNLKAMKINIYVHNLFYDIKPWIIEWNNLYNSKQVLEKTKAKKWRNPFTGHMESFEVLDSNRGLQEPYSYKPTLKKGQMYACEFYGEVKKEGKNSVQKTITFKDSYKIATLSLATATQNFLGLELPKDGLDYDKIRSIDDELTYEEKGYIYDDVFALKYLIRKLVIEGFTINGREVKYTKLTNSSQSLADYKLMLLEDYTNNTNTFNDSNFKERIEHTLLLKSAFYKESTTDTLKSNLLFEAIFPKLSYYEDDILRKAYFGGMTYVDFDNIKRLESKYNHRNGLVFDVNSLYPFTMEHFELPFGRGNFGIGVPYDKMSNSYRKEYPLYVQEIKIYEFNVKENKIPFIQIKDNENFNGRQIQKNNINLYGQRESVTLWLPKPLFELLFECYNVESYELGSHYAFESKKGLFTNYMNFWGNIKRNSKGAEKQVSKLRQNSLYGKFGTSGENEITLIDTSNDVFKIEHTHTNYIGDTLYLPIALFITAFAKSHLINAINQNRDRFMYCDTDSIHLHGTDPVKGIMIDDNVYGAWKHEMTFDDYRYIGSKRYAERDSKTGKWEFKCCGLSAKVMNQIDDINTFDMCPHSGKELKKMKLYTRDDIYYYYDKECSKRIKGLFRSSKAKIVEGGTLIIEQPYQLTQSNFFY